MNVPDIIIVLGLVAFAVEELNAKGRAIGWWGGILVCVALLWPF
jgi:drug/metabolite transporter superfamily protein YnfA